MKPVQGQYTQANSQED